MLLIVCFLDLTSSLCLFNGQTHGIRHIVRIHDYMAFAVSRSTANGLNEGCLGSQESFLIRIQNCHQRNLRNIQSLSQQVDTHQHIKDIQTHIPDNLRPLQRIHIGMQVTHPDTQFLHIVGQIFRHTLGQGGDQYLMVGCHFFINLTDQVIDLPFHRTHHYLRIQKSGRTDNLLRS